MHATLYFSNSAYIYQTHKCFFTFVIVPFSHFMSSSSSFSSTRVYLHQTLDKINALIISYKGGYLYFRRVQLGLRVPILLLSTALTFGSFGSTTHSTSPSGLPWIMGVFSLCVSVLTGLENFLKPSETMQQCRSTFLSLLALKHSIEQFLTTGKPCMSFLEEDEQSMDSNLSVSSMESAFLQSVFDKFTQIISMAPILSRTQEMSVVPATADSASNIIPSPSPKPKSRPTLPSLPIPMSTTRVSTPQVQAPDDPEMSWRATNLHRDTSN